ncbi:MAG: cellulase family glycosylhydrolase, partial [Treponema sp.]|nr:cellulase family glycosylhydrolase [Treponema sp.]
MLIRQNRIVDDTGRVLVLRGLNLGGDSKVPRDPSPEGGAGGSPRRWGLEAQSLENPGDASFVGRPFPLEEADERLAQLVRWGFSFVRLPITWEALEHQGPGQYDESYLAYLRKLLLAMEKWGIAVYIDPHQDVWSRFTGGDGAPAWTLEELGMRPELMDATGAAFTWQRYGEYHGGRPCPPMSWPANYNRYAAATMFSLFFGG